MSGSSPTLTVPSHKTIDLEKAEAYSREEIINVHYTDDDEATVTASTKSSIGWYAHAFDGIWQFRHRHRDFLAEFLGTSILILLVDGVSAEQILGVGMKSWITTAFGNGLAVLFAISVCGHISGAHMNPAITITLWFFRKFPGRNVPVYCAAQFLGAFTGAAVLYSIITPAIDQFDGGHREILGEHGTAGIFATYPPLYVGIASAVASEVVGTALLTLLVMTTGHPRNQPFCAIQGVVVASGITAILLAIGYTSGFSLNPARDIGPRVFTAIAGWGPGVFTAHHYYAIVPMFAPFLGAFVGGVFYTIFIDHTI